MSEETPHIPIVLTVYAADLPECPCCGEPWCPLHEAHYADCPCIGPNSELTLN